MKAERLIYAGIPREASHPKRLTTGDSMRFREGYILLTALFLVVLTCKGEETDIKNLQWEPPALTDPGSWSLILVPDTQSYVKFARNQPILDLMMEWILDSRDDLNTGMVLCTGDLVEQNEMLNPTGIKMDRTSREQWEAVSSSFGRLDGILPYIVTTGNHDFGYRNVENRNSHFSEYFPVEKNRLTRDMVREVGLNANDHPTLENALFEFQSPDGRDFLVLVLEFAPRETIIGWARSVVNYEKYANHTVILLTHSFLEANNERVDWEPEYPLTDANYGEGMWSKLVSPAKNIRLVINGHIGAARDARAHVGFRTDLNEAGRVVNQMAFNAQALGGGWYGNGGDGWIRILEFLPDGKTVKVRTFSPLFAISPKTREHAWRREPWDEFTFTID